VFLQSPVDARKTLAENIIVIGGTSMLLGFKARLAEELRDLREKPRYKERLFVDAFKFHSPPGKENYVAWLGGQFGFGLLFNMASLHTLHLNRTLPFSEISKETFAVDIHFLFCQYLNNEVYSIKLF